MKKMMVVLAMVVVFGLAVIGTKGVITLANTQSETMEDKIVRSFEQEGHEVVYCDIQDENNYQVCYIDGKYGNYRIYEVHDTNWSDVNDERSNIARQMVVTRLSVTKGE